MTKQEDKVVATTKRIDMHTSTVHNGLLELQRAIQQGYVIDFSKTPARARASRIIVTLVGANNDVNATSIETTSEVVAEEKETTQKAPRKKAVQVKTDEKE